MANHLHGAERAVHEALGVVLWCAQIAHHLQVHAIAINQDAPNVDGPIDELDTALRTGAADWDICSVR